MKPRVLVDCDQVLCDFLNPLAKLVSAIWRPLDMSQMKTWNLYDAFEVPRPVEDSANEVLASPGYARTLPLMTGALEGMHLLMQHADVYVVTAPWHSSPTWRNDREWWLKHHFGIPRHKVLPIDEKHVTAGDALIDDKTSTLVNWQRAFPNGLAIQWPHPSLKHSPSPFLQPTCWEDAVDDIVEHHQQRKPRIWHHE